MYTAGNNGVEKMFIGNYLIRVKSQEPRTKSQEPRRKWQ